MKKGKFTIIAGLSLGLLFGGAATIGHQDVSAAAKSKVTTYKYKTHKTYKHAGKHCHIVQKPGSQNKPVTTPPTVQKPTDEAPSVQKPVEKPATPEKPGDSQQVQADVSAFEQEVVTLTNKERTSRGLKALQIDTKLSKSAHAKSEDMQKKNYFSHTSPTYGSPFDMMKQFGVTYKSAGENIAKGQKTPKEVVNAWMNSEGHRANILNASFTHIGVGYVESGSIWTQQFIGK